MLVWSESRTNIAAALLEAQKIITTVAKERTAKVKTSKADYEYDYADLSDVIAAVKAPLNNNGIVIVQGARADEKGIFASTTLQHTSGEFVSDELYMPVAGVAAQSYGSAITFAKRYLLQSMCNLPGENDDDGKRAGDTKRKDGGARQTAVDAFDSMGEEEQRFLQREAEKMIQLHEINGDVRDYYEKQRYTNEEKLAVWSLLPSAIRTAIKKAPDKSRNGSQQFTPEELGGQA